ncbi:ZN638 protein, partial [Atrichornis clamosus]|nr:ZN638 protein [Atrichornis clamosus]
SSGLKKNPEGSGVVPRAAANPPGEPRVAKKGPIPSPNVTEEVPAGQLQPPESHLGGAARESPSGTAVEDVDAGIGVPVAPAQGAGTKSPGARSEEKPVPPCGVGKEEAHPEPEFVVEKEIKKEGEESSTPAVEALGSSSKAEDEPAVIPAAGEPTGVIPGAVPPRPGEASVDVASPGVTQPTTESGAPEKSPVPEAGKTKHETYVASVAERKPVPKSVEAPGRKVDVAGAEREVKPEESMLKAGHTAGENLGKLLVKAGAEPEKPLGKSASKGVTTVENTGNAVGESHVGSLIKSHQNNGTGAAKADETHPAAPLNPPLSLKESCIAKTLLKAVVSVPDILKQRIPMRSNEPSLCKAGEQKFPTKAEPRGQAGTEKKIPSKATAQPGPGSSHWKGNGSSGEDGQGDNGRNSSQQEKDSQVESRAGSKQCQEGESGTSGTKEDPGSNQVRRAGRPVPFEALLHSRFSTSQEEELFPFNLDEFVTVDEVVEEIESPVTTRRNPPRGKRKAGAKPNPSEPMSKKRKGKSSGASAAEGELSFVTLDEIGEEEDAPVPLPGVDPQALVVVDEVVEEEELSEAVKDPQALVTLDEISEQEELGSHRDGPRPEFEERDLKAEPLVTVDEIGEVEELPLNEPTELSVEEGKANPGDCAASQVPDDPNALVTVDEIQEDNEDNPLVTLDEVNEDEDDFLADFNHLKEELNFVTVDEVGDEEEENAFPGKNLPEDDDEDIVAVAGPEEMGILGDTNPEEEVAEVSKPKGEEPQGQVGWGLEQPGIVGGVPAHGRDGTGWSLGPSQPKAFHDSIPFQRAFLSPAAQLGSGDAEPKSQQKKTTFPGVPKTQSTPKALDILVPKAGFFCQICSLFYADEPSMINHCRTPLHRQNMEKFIAKQQDNGGEEASSR